MYTPHTQARGGMFLIARKLSEALFRAASVQSAASWKERLREYTLND